MNFRNWMVFKQSTEFADPLESNDDLRELADAIKKDRQFPRDADSLQSASFSYNPVSQRYIVMITYSEKQRQKVDDNC